MSILQVVTSEVGLVGVEPAYIYIKTDNTLAEVEVPGYLNQLIPMGYNISSFNAALVYTTDFGAVVLQIVKNGANYSLTQTIAGGGGVASVSGTAGQIASTMGVNPVLSLVNTAVVPGVYTNASLTVDAKGRLTAAASGTAPVTAVNGTASQIAITGGATTPTVGFATNVTFPGTVTLNQDPSAPLQAVTKQYVDMLVAGLTFKAACTAATTGALTATYDNGVSGVGATLTNSGALAALEIDDVALAVGERVLVKNQGSGFQNGIYEVTVVGDGATPWELTRAADYDVLSEISEGDFVIIVEGTANATTGWIQTSNVSNIGVSSITFTQFGIIGTGVTSVSGTLNRISVTNPATTPVVDIASTYVGQTSITTLGTVGTGTWAGSVVAGQYGGTGVANTGKTITIGGNLTTSGANDVTFTTTGATNVTLPTTGTLATTTDLITVGNGGTGATTFTAYSVICAGTTATGAFQNVSGLGTAGQVLTSNGAGALPSWQSVGGGTVTSVSGTADRITSTGGATPVIDIASTYVGQTSITTLGTVGTGTWNGSIVTGTYGGTGVNNGANTITLGGNISTAAAFTTSGANALTLTTTGATNVTLPTTGTLVTTTTAAELNKTNDFNFNILQEAQLKNYSETVSATGNITGTASFDLANGNIFTATVTGTVTISFANPAASGQCSSATLILTNGGSAAITWTDVAWAGGVAPTLTTSGVDILTFFTTNAGTTWYGVVAGKAFA